MTGEEAYPSAKRAKDVRESGVSFGKKAKDVEGSGVSFGKMPKDVGERGEKEVEVERKR